MVKLLKAKDQGRDIECYPLAKFIYKEQALKKRTNQNNIIKWFYISKNYL